jgi:hypothetical protein
MRLIVALVAVAGLVTDLVTKIIAVTQLEPLDSVRLLGGLLTCHGSVIRLGPWPSDSCVPALRATSPIGCFDLPECCAVM